MTDKTSLTSEQQLANLLPLALIFLDRDLLIQSWNPAAEKLLDLTPDHGNSPIQQLFNQVDFSALRQQPAHEPLEIIPSHHPDLELSLSLVSYQLNQYVLIIRDITQLHHLERMRRDFVANVSHELRTPLTVIRGYLEMLLDDNNAALAPWQQIHSQMYQQSFRMQKLTEDLLMLSRLEGDAPVIKRFKQVDVAILLAGIVEDARVVSDSHQHKIHLHADENLTIYGLEQELVSAFTNLIFNAIHYTPPNGSIWIDWYRDNEGKHACLRVRDTGIGIAPKHIPRLTERFYRVDKARSRSSGGTGLGLAIVKHVLLLHKANLIITSEPGQGSTFTCVFPL